MTDPKRINIDDLADAEDRGDVVDQQTAMEAGIEQTSEGTEGAGNELDDAIESEAHPT